MSLELFVQNCTRQYPTALMYVTESIKEAILQGIIESGESLPQDRIARIFKVSQSPVREALRLLEEQGLVSYLPNKGAVVSQLSPEVVKELFEIRFFLESGALSLAIPNFTLSDYEQCKKLYVIADTHPDPLTRCKFDFKFHQTLYRPSNRLYMLNIIESVHFNTLRYLRLYFSLVDMKWPYPSQHENLLNACFENDLSTAMDILQKHLLQVSDLLVQFLTDHYANEYQIVPNE